MKRVQSAVAAAALLLGVLFARSALGQTAPRVGTPGTAYPRSVEGSVGAGTTAITAEEWAGRSLVDSDAFNYQGAFLVLPVRDGNVSFGGELGFQHFFNYTEPGPLSGSSHVYTGHYTATRWLGIVRARAHTGLFVDAGGGLYHFPDLACFGLTVAVGYDIRVSGPLSVPIKGRLDYVFDSRASNMPALDFSAGISYRF